MPFGNKYLFARILGNDVPGLHGENQTIINLKFTLENESQYPNADYVYVLNRIYDINKKKEIIEILNHYNMNYVDIPFSIKEFNEILKKNIRILVEPHNRISNRSKQHLTYFNHYIVNNNGARNFTLRYGRKNNYTWTFVLDSNSYIDDVLYQAIEKAVSEHPDSKYLIMSQARLKDGNLTNDVVLTDSKKIDELPEQEPQIAFHVSTTTVFDQRLPYGSAPKAEFISSLGVPGKWNQWTSLVQAKLNIRPRKINESWIKTSRIVRLHPQESNNDISKNYALREQGILLHVKRVFELFSKK